MRRTYLLVCVGLALSTGCEPQDPTEHHGTEATPPAGPQGPAIPPGTHAGEPAFSQAGASPGDGLAGAWDPSLAAPVGEARAVDPASCPDADGDGYPSAIGCPGGDPSRLDCDDSDPGVTPESERWIPASPFLMGSTSSQAGDDESPIHVVELAGYCLDRTEVETAAFADWLRDSRRRPAGPDVRNLDENGTARPGREHHPAEGVTWEEAHEFCAARGKVLPTEAQWEKAARGGCELGSDPTACDAADLRVYPWGERVPDCTLANHRVTSQGPPRLCVSDSLPVGDGAQGAGPYGHLHLAGNVWEYVEDTYHPAVYSRDRERVDPAGAGEGEFHAMRGGGWNTFSTNMRAANRFNDMVMGSAVGFRCARATVAPIHDPVQPMELVSLSGTISHESGSVRGRALYVTVMDVADTDPRSGMPVPGRSPVAERRLVPDGAAEVSFSIDVPRGRSYLVSAALDDGTSSSEGDHLAASGSGGVGFARGNPVRADADAAGLEIRIERAAMGGPPGAGPGFPGGPAPLPGGPISGGQLQDPTGFPHFHDIPPPGGKAVPGGAAWSGFRQLTSRPTGGYRPQIAVSPDGKKHVIYYERLADGDVIRHRMSADGVQWSEPNTLSFEQGRNWGPDIVARADGTLVVVFDHIAQDFSGRGHLVTWRDGSWTAPQPLTPDDGGEVGSEHIADGPGDELVHIWIGKEVDPNKKFRAHWRWYSDGRWSPTAYFTDGAMDAWHTNVERRPDGSVLAGWDVGLGGGETQLFVTEGRDGTFSPPENLSAGTRPCERPHFAFGDQDHLTCFHKEGGLPTAVLVRPGGPGQWGDMEEPSAGFGGYHFDPDIAIDEGGVRCLVWGWDGGSEAELVYSTDDGSGWTPPRRVADVKWGKPGLPSLSVDVDGRFHVVWNQGVRGYNEVYYARLDTP